MPAVREPRTRSHEQAENAPLSRAARPNHYRVYEGADLGAPFKKAYEDSFISEFTKRPDECWVRTPEDRRPPRLKLRDLECLKVLGEGREQVYLVALKSRGDVDTSPFFALKGLQRSRHRGNALAFLPDSEGKEGKGEKYYGNVREDKIKQHIALANNEKIALTHMPWSPWVTGLIQSFHDSEKIYMALEYIPGGTLRSAITKAHGYQGGGLDIATAQFYYANIVLALEFLESCKLVHCDLKPDNILIGADGYLVLTDFGSAHLAEDRDSALGWKDIGTVYYSAPEACFTCSDRLAEDSPHSIDWWASGIILFEMIAGRMPFCAWSSFGTAELIQCGEYTWPDGLEVGVKLTDLVKRLLAVAPPDRLGTESATEVQAHPWLETVDWDKMDRRGYLAPFVPKDVDKAELWHRMSMPKQAHVPGLKVVEPPIHLAHDNRFPL